MLVGLAGCQMQRGGTYTVPNVLTCTVPDGPNVQVRASTTSPDSGSIQFLDDLGHFYRLDYSRVPSELQDSFQLPQRALKAIFDREVMRTIHSASPDAKAVYEAYSF